MSAKQIKFFGSARQRAALKSKRKRHGPAKKRNAARRRPAAKRRRLNPSRPAHRTRKKAVAAVRPRSRKKAVAKHRKRRNPELVSFLVGNPGRRRSKKTMARHKRKKAAVRSNAGRRRSKKAVTHHRRRRSNPAMIGKPKDWVMGGAGALAGFVGSAAIPQMFLGASGNTGVGGYAASAAAAIGLGFLAHFLFPREQAITVGVVSGGFANLLRRIITDQTPFGSYLNGPAASGGMGMGDYMVVNWGPPRLPNALGSAMAEAPGTAWGGGGGVMTSSGVSMSDMSDIRASRPC